MARGRPIGGSKLSQTKLSLNSTPKINDNFKMKKIEQPDEEHTKYKCTCCGKLYSAQRNNFPASSSPLYAANNGYIQVCKSCVENYYSQMVEFFSGNEEKAIERCCQIFDWYYSDDAVAMTKKVSADKSRIGVYPSKMNMSQVHDNGTIYIDTIRDRKTEVIKCEEDFIEHKVTDTATIKVSQNMIDFWGYGYKPEDYKYLQAQYDDWTARHECKTKAQEELFRAICMSQLNMQIAQRTGVKVPEAMKAFQDLLGSANLKPVQTNENALADQNTFGTLIKKWENEKPIPEPEAEWKDVDGIRKYISTWFLGHLCKMFKIKNEWSAMYEEEKSKFTVKPPQYEEDEPSFDSVFGNSKGDDGDESDEE